MAKEKGITYADHPQYSRVKLDGKHVGDIMRSISGEWFYQPKGVGRDGAGERMKSRDAVKRSIEAV